MVSGGIGSCRSSLAPRARVQPSGVFTLTGGLDGTLPSAGVTAPTSGTTELDVPVTLSAPSTQTVAVAWTTLSVAGAPAGQAPTSDYVAASGTVTFTPGQTTASVPITVTGNSLGVDEYLVVSFTSPANAFMGGFWGLGFGGIDPPP